MKKVLLIMVTAIVISGIGISLGGKYFADGENTGLPSQHSISTDFGTYAGM